MAQAAVHAVLNELGVAAIDVPLTLEHVWRALPGKGVWPARGANLSPAR